MKPIAIHLDRLSRALAAKGVELKRTDLLQVAAAAFGYHNQNEISAASQRGDLTPPHAAPLCRITIPCTPHAREIVVLKAGDEMLYGMDAEFFDGIGDTRAELYGPTPYGTLVDLRHARQELTEGDSDTVSGSLSENARLDHALREARRLRTQLDDLTGESDEQAQDIGQAENTLDRIIAALEGVPSLDKSPIDGTRGHEKGASVLSTDTVTGSDTLWKTSVTFDPGDGAQLQHRSAHFLLPKGMDPTSLGKKIAWQMAGRKKVLRCTMQNASTTHAGIKLLEATRQMLALLPDDFDTGQPLAEAMAFADNVLPTIHDETLTQ